MIQNTSFFFWFIPSPFIQTEFQVVRLVKAGYKVLQGIIKEIVFYVYVHHALIQMTLNISFLFWLNKQLK